MAKYPILIKKHNKIKKPPIPRYDPRVRYNEIFSLPVLKRCFHLTTRGHRRLCTTAWNFYQYDMANLENLHGRLMRIGITPYRDAPDAYRIGPYHHRTIYEPKERSLHIPELQDKVVQLASHNALQRIFCPTYSSRSYSCLIGKGQIRAALDTMHNLRCAHEKWGNAAEIIRIDVRKFFYSIDRDVLKSIVRRRLSRLSCKYPDYREDYLRLYNLFTRIIDSSPEGERGIPLGNVTSQDFANIYMNEVDTFCIRYLKVKYYTRYADDIVIVAPNKDTAREWKSQIVAYLEKHLHLAVNEKTEIFPIRQGVNAFGYKIKATHMLIRDNSKKAMKRKLKHFNCELSEALHDNPDEVYPYVVFPRGADVLTACRQSIGAWVGFSRWACAYKLVEQFREKYPGLPIFTKTKLPFGMFCRKLKLQVADLGFS